MKQNIPEEDLHDIWESTSALWKSYSGHSIFLTGGTGFFGTWLIESFVHACNKGVDIKMTVLTRNPSVFIKRFPHLGESRFLTWLQGDIRSFCPPSTKHSLLIHAATELLGSRSGNGSHLFGAELMGAQHVIHCAQLMQVERILYVSSGAVYGSSPMPVSEESLSSFKALAQDNTYGVGKFMIEKLFDDYANSNAVALSIARCFAFLGPHLPLDQSYAAGNFLLSAARGDPLQITGDGKAVRSYMYPADLAIWLWTMLFQAEGVTLANVGSDVPVSIKELAMQISHVSGSEVLQKGPSSSICSVYYPIIETANRRFGLTLKTDWKTCINKTLTWIRQNHL